VNKYLLRNTFRYIRGHTGRFIAMTCIVLLGAAFFVGVRAAGPDMRLTAQAYYDGQRFSDIRVLSAFGFTEDDINRVRGLPGVEAASAGYTADVLLDRPGRSYVVRLMSNDGLVNAPYLLEGRLPERAGEAAADEKFMADNGAAIGDTVRLTSGKDEPLTDTVTDDAYVIVGVARSPLYTMTVSRAASGIGYGAVNAFLLLDPSAFTMDAYSDISVRVRNPGNISRFDDAYEALVKPVKQELEDLGAERAPVRRDELVSDARSRLDDAKQKLSDAEREITDGAAKLDDAKAQLADSEKQYADEKAKYDNETTDARKKLDDAKAELDDAKTKLDDAKTGLDEGKAKLDDALKTLDTAEETLGQGEEQWNGAKAALDGERTKLDAQAAELEPYRQAIAAYQATLAGIPENTPEYASYTEMIADYTSKYAPRKAALDAAYAQIGAKEAELKAQGDVLAAKRAELEQGRSDYGKNLADYDEKLAEYNANQADYETNLADYDTNLADYNSKSTEGSASLNDARNKLDQAQKDLAAEQAKYDNLVTDNQPKLDDAKAKIADGEKALADVKEPEWYTLDLFANEAFADYKENCNRIIAVGAVFPLVFFLVAVLITLTTMTRTVEEDRVQTGILKALGYSGGQIAAKYAVFAALANALGLAAGLALGFNLFPRLIANAYGILFRFPPLETPADLFYAMLASALALACTLGTALIVSGRSLRECPANLMLPKAPPPGRRIFLEYVQFFWRRLGFLQKVTARNIFRYVRRLLMTLVGIAGCAALTFTGFGLNEAVHSSVPNQFSRVVVYDFSAQFSTGDTDEARAEAAERFAGLAASSLPVAVKTVNIDSGGEPRSVTMICPLDPGRLDGFIRLRDPATGEQVNLTDGGVVLTDKAARLMGVGVGDSLRIRVDEGKYVSLPITALAENYINHFIYITPAVYGTLFGAEPAAGSVYGVMKPGADKEALAAEILADSGFAGVGFTADTRANLEDMVSAMGYVVAVLILSAAALAFTVLFSLSGVNVEERRREIATIKVLGFFDREVSRYINRETLVLALAGAAAGLALGVWLLRFVVNTAEVDILVFSRNTTVWSYIWSYLMTVGFTLIVNRIVSFRLHRIDMVESLKSVE